MVAGIVLACLAFFIAVILLVAFFYFRRRRRHKSKPPASPTAGDTLPSIAYPDATHPGNGVAMQVAPFTFDQLTGTPYSEQDPPPPYRPSAKDERPRSGRANGESVRVEDDSGFSDGTVQQVQRPAQSQRVVPAGHNRRRATQHSSLPSRRRRSQHAMTSNAFNVDHVIPAHMHGQQVRESDYVPRKYVPDPTENPPSRFHRSQSLMPVPPRPLPSPPSTSTLVAYPPRSRSRSHKRINLGVRSLQPSRPRNYMNQPMCECDSDSVATNTDHIYETLNLPSDSDNQSRCGSTHTLNHPHARHSRLSTASHSHASNDTAHPRTLSASSGDVFLGAPVAAPAAQHGDAMHAEQLGPGFRKHSSTADAGLSQTHARMLYPAHTGAPVMHDDVMKSHIDKTSNLHSPRFAVGNHRSSSHSAFMPQPSKHAPTVPPPGNSTGPSAFHPAAAGFPQTPSNAWQGTATTPLQDQRDLTTPDSLSRLIPSSNNSSFDQTAHAHAHLQQPAVVFLSDAQSLLMNPTSV